MTKADFKSDLELKEEPYYIKPYLFEPEYTEEETVKKMIVANMEGVLLQHIPQCTDTDTWMSDGKQPQLASFQIFNQPNDGNR